MHMNGHPLLGNPRHVLWAADVDFRDSIGGVFVEHHRDLTCDLTSTHVLLVRTLVENKSNLIEKIKHLHQRLCSCSFPSWTTHNEFVALTASSWRKPLKSATEVKKWNCATSKYVKNPKNFTSIKTELANSIASACSSNWEDKELNYSRYILMIHMMSHYYT